MLPPKIKRSKMGVRSFGVDVAGRIERVRLVWPRHERWVRQRSCCVPGCPCTPIEFMHLRTAANSGKSEKPHSGFGISGCTHHHREAHVIGHNAFSAKYHIDLWGLAAEFVTRSPDRRMRESFGQLPLHLQGLLYPERLAA